MTNKNNSGLGGFSKGLSVKPRILMTIDNDNDEDDEESFKPDMQEVGDFVGKLLMAAPVVQMLHLQTDSYAKHMALGALYAELPGLVDVVAEEFQGMYGVISSYNTYIDFNANPFIFVEGVLNHVKKYRGDMGPCSSMQSEIDLIETALKTCLYKLKNLK